MKRNAYSDLDLSAEPDLGALLDDWQEIMPRLRKARGAPIKPTESIDLRRDPPSSSPRRTIAVFSGPRRRLESSGTPTRLTSSSIFSVSQSRAGRRYKRRSVRPGRGDSAAAWRDWSDARKEARREVDKTEWQLMQIENDRDVEHVWGRSARTRARTVSGVIAKAQVAVGCPSHLLVFEPLHLSIARDLRALKQA